jgi:hypothetical protein
MPSRVASPYLGADGTVTNIMSNPCTLEVSRQDGSQIRPSVIQRPDSMPLSADDDLASQHLQQLAFLNHKLHETAEQLLSASQQATSLFTPGTTAYIQASKHVGVCRIIINGQHCARKCCTSEYVLAGIASDINDLPKEHKYLDGTLTSDVDECGRGQSPTNTRRLINHLQDDHDPNDNPRTMDTFLSGGSRYKTDSGIVNQLRLMKDRIMELENDVAIVRSEKQAILESNAQMSAKLQLDLEQTKDTLRTLEVDHGIQMDHVLCKLNAARVQAEDITSQGSCETPASALRQLETLQSQYAAARNNWEGIQASLNAQISTLEKEKEEAMLRASGMRRKAHESAIRYKEEIQSLQSSLEHAQQEIKEYQDIARDTTYPPPLPNKEILIDGPTSDINVPRSSSPSACVSTDLGVIRSGIQTQASVETKLPLIPWAMQKNLAIPLLTNADVDLGDAADGDTQLSSKDRIISPTTPQSSTQDIIATNTVLSTSQTMQPGSRGSYPVLAEVTETSSVDPWAFSSARHTGRDMASVSTSTAGPSVQLVERMSAAIRRLEAERVSRREELARVCVQRDDARFTISQLLKDVDSHVATSHRVAELENLLDDINARYQTTLEMLGEKSEIVEELQADISDLKQMYRELVQRTV